MAYKITDKPNAEGVSGTYPYGSIKDNTGGGNGVPVNRLVYTDIHQFFARIADLAGVVLNSSPDNAVNGWQFVTALQNLINAAVAAEAAIRAAADTTLQNQINSLTSSTVTALTLVAGWAQDPAVGLSFGYLKQPNKLIIFRGAISQSSLTGTTFVIIDDSNVPAAIKSGLPGFFAVPLYVKDGSGVTVPAQFEYQVGIGFFVRLETAIASGTLNINLNSVSFLGA